MRTSIKAACATALICCSLFASTSAGRTNEILSFFNKTKHVDKMKRGVRKAVFVERHGEPVVQRDIAQYAGAYETQGLGFSLQLTINNGRVTGSGNDRGRAFTLTNARIDGALLTATKVYANGGFGTLEGVFMDLVSREGTSPDDAVTSRAFGLGVLPEERVEVDGQFSTDRLFYGRVGVPRS